MEFTKEQSELLAKFVLEVLEEWPDMGSLDGGDLQEIGEKHKILIPHIVHGPCSDNCYCSEFYSNEEWQSGVTCYRLPDWLVRDAQLRIGADDAGHTCPNCNGTGKGGGIGLSYTCPQCNGSGQV